MTKIAEVGDKIRITNADPFLEGMYENGDEFTVEKVWGIDCDDGVTTSEGHTIYDYEFEVIDSEEDGIGAPDNPAYLIAKLTERVTELESDIKRVKDAIG